MSSAHSDSSHVGISAFARETGLSVDTLRYYEQAGLLKPPRNARNQRRYGPPERAWLAFVLRLKQTHMPLAQIKHYARLRAEGNDTLADRLALLQQHQSALQQNLLQLQAHMTHLAAKIEYYQALLPAPTTTAANQQTTSSD